ncbi:hypothetical protein K2173_025758 [Erythroxylum novogranatense]|uniref:Uncharacterized protein n=1 Tax=Erythroxylum novogranatense TaxID=1862640 RepID=A0AAV8T2R8_9ROSI|nr:hypothetical protein K2173_025758 [Erythroxylum novogranatense]
MHSPDREKPPFQNAAVIDSLEPTPQAEEKKEETVACLKPPRLTGFPCQICLSYHGFQEILSSELSIVSIFGTNPPSVSLSLPRSSPLVLKEFRLFIKLNSRPGSQSFAAFLPHVKCWYSLGVTKQHQSGTHGMENTI